MEVIEKDAVYIDEFFREFLAKKICSKNEFNRCAGKLHFISRFLRTSKIPFNLVLSVMERHQQMIFDDDNRTIKSPQLNSLLHDIFYAADKLSLITEPLKWSKDHVLVPLDADRQASLLASYLASVFDPSHTRSITLLELKIALLLLCATNSVEEWVQHHLNLLIDHNRCIHQTRFKLALGAILKFLHRLDHNIPSDGDTLNSLVNHSFAKVTGLAGLSDTQFYQMWSTESKKNPTEVGYFFSLILYARALDNHSVHEGFSCTACNSPANQQHPAEPPCIIGIRFKCSRCSLLNLCTVCFLSDFQTARHNPVTHKFTMVKESSEVKDEEQHGKRGNVLAKLLRVFYFLRNKREANSDSPDKDHQESIRGDGVKTIRFLDETPRNTSKATTADGKDKLLTVIEMLTMENHLFQQNLEQIQKTCSPDGEFHKYLEQHKNILTSQIAHLQVIWKSSEAEKLSSISSPPAQQQKFHSTPFRRDHLRRSINWDLTGLDASTVTVVNDAGTASKHIRGEDIEKSYYEANRSNRSLQEISTWLHLRDSFCRELISGTGDKSLTLDGSGMQSFRDLLHKVRDILEDTYSDNVQLSTVTRQLEDALDEIIGKEERRLLPTQGSMMGTAAKQTT